MPLVLQSVEPRNPDRLANSYGIGWPLFAHPTIDRFLESEVVDSTINPLMDNSSATRTGGTLEFLFGTLRRIEIEAQVYGGAGHFREQMIRFAKEVMPTFEKLGVIA